MVVPGAVEAATVVIVVADVVVVVDAVGDDAFDFVKRSSSRTFIRCRI